jgi:hypothetical protein
MKTNNPKLAEIIAKINQDNKEKEANKQWKNFSSQLKMKQLSKDGLKIVIRN